MFDTRKKQYVECCARSYKREAVTAISSFDSFTVRSRSLFEAYINKVEFVEF